MPAIGTSEIPALPTAPAQAEPRGTRDALVAVVVIFVTTALAYSNTLRSSFHLDDQYRIVENSQLRAISNLWPPLDNRYLGDLSFALNFRLGGLDPFGYHLANLLVHLCNGLLVAWLAALTLRTPALRDVESGPMFRRWLPLWAGLLFALHPVQTQAVTYVVQRFASLATLLYLMSLVLYVKARLSLEADRSPRLRAFCLHLLSVAFAVAAMRTKEISFTLPLVTAGFELVLFRGAGRRFILLVPVAATALLVPLGLAVNGRDLADVLGDASQIVETGEIPRSVYLLTQSRVLATYLRLLVLPIDQNLDYDFRLSRSLSEPSVLLSSAILVAVVAGAVALLVQARRRHRAAGALVFVGVAWFFVTSSVESSVIPIRDVIAEHRMYLPSVGAALAVGTALLWGIERLHSPIPIGLQCCAGLFLTAAPLGAATYARNLVWRDDVTLWSDVVAKSPRKARPRINLGIGLWKAGRFDEAIREYREAIRLDPGSPHAHDNLGIALYGAGRGLEDATREFREAIRLDPNHASAHANLGFAYQLMGRIDESVQELREAIRLKPGLAQARVNLGVSYGMKRSLPEAMSELREALRLDPARADAHFYLGLAYDEAGRPDLAAYEYREALRLDPGLVQARENLRALPVRRTP